MDHRDRAAAEGRWYEEFDESSMEAVVLDCDEEGDEEEVRVPCTYGVCPTCDGRGSHVNPSVDAHGISAEEWERDWDEDECEGYLSGRYDVPCAECGGLRVVPVPDEGRLDERAREAVEAGRRSQRYNYEDAMIRRMESGGWG